VNGAPFSCATIVAMSASQEARNVQGYDQRIITGTAWTIFCWIFDCKSGVALPLSLDH